MGHETFNNQKWALTPGGKVILRLIEKWEAGVTEHGDIALSFVTTVGNDPYIPSGEPHRAQFICTEEDARQIAHMILRTLAFAETGKPSDFAAFRDKIKSPALRALADHWNEVRGDRSMPAWEDLRQGSFAAHVGGWWGYDYDQGSDTFSGRLAGSNIMHMFGQGFLGASLAAMHPPQVVELGRSVFKRIMSDPACAHFSGKLYRMGQGFIRGERIMLPMGADADNPYGVLGACEHHPDIPLRASDDRELICDNQDWCEV